jgi:hypothetical protein
LHQPEFADEKLARAFLEHLLSRWFYLKPEAQIMSDSKNQLRVDYLAKPRPDVAFPFRLFGIECKRSNRAGAFNRAVKQAADYASCAIVDQRNTLAGVRGKRLEHVYLFPAPTNLRADYERGWHDGVERLGGLCRVGLIYVRHTGQPQFCMSAERHWDPDNGSMVRLIHTRRSIGNGTLRRPAEEAAT